MANKNLNAAKTAKKDEFYTQMGDIERELQHYWPHFRDKVVLCNCDDPYESNFFKYFALNFNQLGLKKLICTCYDGSPVQGNELLLDFGDFTDDPKKIAYKVEITEVKDLNGDGAVDLADVQYLLKNDKNAISLLKQHGDFRSAECIELLKQADIVVTNPPFSLFREYIGQLMQYEKKFLIIGNVNSVSYKETFQYIKNNQLWLGASIHSGDREFGVPNDYPLNAAGCRQDAKGNKFIRVKGVRWFTNLDYNERHEDLILYRSYSPDIYPKYADFDAINVDKTSEIPMDYDDVMGVPITFLDKYNPEQFEILHCCEPCIDVAILRKMEGFKEYLSRQKVYNGQLCQKTYHRILIRRRRGDGNVVGANNDSPLRMEPSKRDADPALPMAAEPDAEYGVKK